MQITEENFNSVVTLPVCHLTCIPDATLLPKPVTFESIDRSDIIEISIENIDFQLPSFDNQREYWHETSQRFLQVVTSKIPSYTALDLELVNEKKLTIKFDVELSSLELVMATNESYSIQINQSDEDGVLVEINAISYYGARHGLETLSQLIIFNEFSNKFVMLQNTKIVDNPVYKHRGILLDTARRFYPIDSIKRTIDAMSLVKLNVFHWHITDANSFALVLKSHPELSIIGSYGINKIYTHEDITQIIKYAKIRGVRVIPELDAPSHIAEGWQNTGLVVCYNIKPWAPYCAGPPCGQLDPTQDRLYDYLEDIYGDMYEMFENPELFHMGGDEVKSRCWETSSNITNWMREQGWNPSTDYKKLWAHFQENAFASLEKVAPAGSKVILWSSTLTSVSNVLEYLNPKQYVIQIWTEGTDAGINKLLSQGYDLIMSNVDHFYFDCGFSTYVSNADHWCSPYKGWQRVYDNNLKNLAGSYHSQILGGEGCLWSSVSDEHTLDSRLWPRSSALAERLWAEPENDYRGAEARMLLHREYLVLYGLSAESIQPEWCMQHESECIG